MTSTTPAVARMRDIRALAYCAIAFFVAHQVGLRTISPESPLSPVWPPAGVALAIFVLLRRAMWPWAICIIIAIDALSSVVAGVRISVSLAYLVPSGIELAVAYWLLQRIAGPGINFRRSRDTLALVVASTGGATAGGLVAGAVAGFAAGAPFRQSALTWLVADLLGMLLITPLILSWARGRSLPRDEWLMRGGEGMLVLAFWTWMAYRLFQADVTIGWLRPHPYLLAPVMVWAAFRLGIRGVTAAMATISVVAIGVALTHPATFALGGATLAERLLLVQVFLVVMGITGLLLASALAERSEAAEAAREYARRLQALSDNVPNGVTYQLARDADGVKRFKHISANVTRVLGVSPSAAMRDPAVLYDLIPETERARISAAEDQSERELTEFSVETQLRTVDGRDRWMLLASTPRRQGDGRVVWDGITIDITDRRHAEERLIRANRALRTIVNGNQVLVRARSETELLESICQVIVEDGGYRMAWVGFALQDEGKRVKPAAHAGFESGYLERLTISWGENALGFGPSGIAIRSARPVVSHDVLTDPTFAIWRDQAIAQGYRSLLVLPLRTPERVIGTLSVYATEAHAFDEDEIALMMELADDLAFGITALRASAERAAAQAALAESEERFRQLTENIREIFWMTDAVTGELLYISPSVERLYGVSAATLMQSSEAGIQRIHPDDRARLLAASEAAVAGGILDEEYRVLHVNGTLSWVHGRAFPVRNADGAIYRLVGVSDDITARKGIEEQLRQVQRLEAIGQLAGGVAHDFNNIIGAIMMQAGMARSLTGVPPVVTELLQDIEASSQRASNLTRQLLLFGRKQAMQERTVELNELVADLTRMLRRVVPEHVQLQLGLQPGSLAVLADPGMLEQVVMNLTVNSRDAMPLGGILFIETLARTLSDAEVRAFPGARPGLFAGVRVRDTGTGIAAEHLGHIFEPFFTTKEPGKGTGLGLATVFGIVQQHRGVITVESAPGAGTSIEVLLPATAVRAAERLVEQSPMAAAPPGSRTILVVEDDRTVRTMTQRILEHHGYRVHTASSGREALDEWERYAPRVDLLLTDMVMPGGVGGAELAATLQQREPSLRVVYSSGYDPDHETHRTRLEPGVNFLQKPATPRQIVEMVGQMLASA